ncbi:MAG: recombinase RecA [Treponema sp.]|jgi:recombination protein RecA|nr:recombinase RecA [Treponema sp.]
MAKVTEEKTRVTPASAEEKQKALEAARLQIEKQYGAGSIIRMGDTTNTTGIEIVPSGAILLDEALGIGGYPRGRIIEIFGPESSGKTTLALHAVAEAQKLGGIAAFVDAEHALDPVYAKNLGVNIDDLWVSQPDSGEQALEITESLVRSGAVDIIVVDSVAALTPQAEIDGDMGDAQMGLQARLMSQAMRKLTAIIGKSRTLLIFINQIRMKIGVMFGNPETTTGGNALKFYASVRLEVRKTETIEGGKDENALGNRVRVKVVKNKVAPPFRKAELDILFGKGVSATASLLDAAVKYTIIDKKGAWYSYGEEKVGQGREGAKEYLDQHPEFTREVEQKLRSVIFPGREFPVPGQNAARTAKNPAAAAPAPAASAPAEAAAVEAAPAAPVTAAAAEPKEASSKPAEAPEPRARESERTASAEDSQPAHRGPGRPRKVVPATEDEPDGLF